MAYLSGGSATVRARFREAERGEIRLCSVVKAELLYGARNSARVSENLRTLEVFFRQFASLPFDDRAAELYGVVRAQLKRAGTPVGANDMLIASIALAEGATLVTRDARELRLVPGLRVEAW